MHKFTVTVFIEPAAPGKPALGAPCNGCGLCCLLEPCPLGVVLSGYRQGACQTLRWQPGPKLYRCGAIISPKEVLRARLPVYLRGIVVPLAWLLGRLARRWVAAGLGCDCDAKALDYPKVSSTPQA